MGGKQKRGEEKKGEEKEGEERPRERRKKKRGRGEERRILVSLVGVESCCQLNLIH